MRIRVKQSPFRPSYWHIEVKPWWSLNWRVVDSAWGDPGAKDRAVAMAHALANPVIIPIRPKD